MRRELSSVRKKAPPLLTSRSALNRSTHTEPMSALMLNRCPHRVRCTAFTVAPNPPATKNTPNISAPAAGFHFTQAESARASIARTTIHTHEPKNKPRASAPLSPIQLHPSR